MSATLVSVALLLAGLIGVIGRPTGAEAAPAPSPATSIARAAVAQSKVAGMVVGTIGQTESPATAMSRLAADGINTVSLFVWWWADEPTSDSISPYTGTESDAELTSDIQAAHAAGLKVILSPIFDCGGCQGGWRGVMEPSNVPQFFASYRAFMDHYAQLAQADDVWLLFVGSEMTSLEGQTAQWESVITSARQYYSGQVGYEQNWDVVGQPQFLSDVDVVGVSAYFPLDDSADPTEAQLLSDWTDSQDATYKGRNWVNDLVHLADSTGKPILFGEVGYMASDYAARQPFDNDDIDSNPTLQANLYQALLQTFSGYSWWMGVAWWEWSDNAADAARTPMGKAAETFLSNWYVNGWRPGATTSSSSGSSPATTPTTTAASGNGSNSSTGTASGGANGSGAASATDGEQTPLASSTSSHSSGPGAGQKGSVVGGSEVVNGAPVSLPPATTAGGHAGTSPGQGTLSSGHAEATGLPGDQVIIGSPAANRDRAVDILGLLAILALAATGAALPVVGLRPLAADRRRRPLLPVEDWD